MRSVRLRIALLTGGLAALFALGAAGYRKLEGQRINALVRRSAEQSLAAADIERLTGIDRANFANFIVDYTWWDELANYVIRPDAKWAVDNLDTSFDAVKTDGIWVLDKSLRVVYAKVKPGLRLSRDLPAPAEAIRDRLQRKPFTVFWANTNLGLAEIRGGRIHYSNDPDRTGPFTGYLVGAHLWSPTDAAQLGQVATCTAKLRPTTKLDQTQAGITTSDDGRFRIFLPLRDVTEQTVGTLELFGTSPEAQAIAEAAIRERWLLGIFALFLYATVVTALSVWISRPLRAITEALKTQTAAPLQDLAQQSDEFGQIAVILQQFVSQKEQLEQEIAQRKAAMDALTASEQRLKGILATVQSGIFMVDADTHLIVEANPAVLTMVGGERDDIVGHPCFDCVCPTERGRCPVTDLGKAVDNAERVLVRRDGSQVPVLKSVKRVEIGGKDYLIESVTDITPLKKAQEELAESQRRYLEFFTLNPVPCWVYDLDTLRFVDVNEAALRHYGYTRDEFLKLTLPDIRPGEDAATLRQMLRQETGIRHRQAVRYRTKDGRDLDVDTTSIPIVVDGRPCRLVVAYDVTERVAAEARAEAFRRELERSNRELQDFASVASHDLQEPLRKINAFGNRLEQKYGHTLPPEAKDYLDRMLNAVKRMQTLIEDLLTYSRVTTRAKPFEPVDLNTVLKEVLGDLEARIAVSGGTVEAGRLPTIEADPTQMRQLFQNLIGNALKFRKPDVPPVVRISGELVEVDGRKWCRLVVADNGIGFDNQYAERIFGVFERLHGRAEYEGTGMGLAIVRKLVTRHGGTITADGKPGEGATFTILLPAGHPEQANQSPAVATS